MATLLTLLELGLILCLCTANVWLVLKLWHDPTGRRLITFVGQNSWLVLRLIAWILFQVLRHTIIGLGYALLVLGLLAHLAIHARTTGRQAIARGQQHVHLTAIRRAGYQCSICGERTPWWRWFWPIQLFLIPNWPDVSGHLKGTYACKECRHKLHQEKAPSNRWGISWESDPTQPWWEPLVIVGSFVGLVAIGTLAIQLFSY